MSNCELLKNIKELHDKYVNIWKDFASIESPTGYKEGVDACGRYFIKYAEEMGWRVEVLKQEKSGDAVCITMNPEVDAKPISLSGHMDTVFSVGLFGDPAVRMDDKKIYGPGVQDCKGGIVAGFLAMEALQKCGYKARPVQMLLQSDEETGSSTSNKATINWICDKAEGSEAFFNLEPGAPDTVCIERKGIVNFNFTVKGIEAHSSLCATQGANAILDAAHKIIECEKLKDASGITCCCSIVSGGTKGNIVPGECKFTANVRYATKAQYDEVAKYMENLASTVHVPGCTATVSYGPGRPPIELCERNIELLNRVNAILKANGMNELKQSKGTGGTDAAYITLRGIPALDALGTYGAFIHSTNEYSLLSSLDDSAAVLGTAILGL